MGQGVQLPQGGRPAPCLWQPASVHAHPRRGRAGREDPPGVRQGVAVMRWRGSSDPSLMDEDYEAAVMTVADFLPGGMMLQGGSHVTSRTSTSTSSSMGRRSRCSTPCQSGRPTWSARPAGPRPTRTASSRSSRNICSCHAGSVNPWSYLRERRKKE